MEHKMGIMWLRKDNLKCWWWRREWRYNYC